MSNIAPNEQFAPYGAPQMQAPILPKPPWWKRTWVVAVAAGLLGIGIGGASAGSADVTTTPEYKSIAADLDQANADLDQAKDDLADTSAELEEIAGDLPAREDAVEDAEAELEQSRAKLDKREKELERAEASVAKREKAVGVIEKEIEANTIPGDGVFEVGVDMKAGAYKTSGSTDCYYAVNGDANGNDIKSNNITSGPATVTVNSGEFFETQGCADWVLQH